MSTISTLDFRVQNAVNFIDSMYGPEGENAAYVFIGKPTPWPDENKPPLPIGNLEEFFDVYQQLLSMRRIQGNECFPMFRRINWQSGVVYDYYRHDYSATNPAY